MHHHIVSLITISIQILCSERMVFSGEGSERVKDIVGPVTIVAPTQSYKYRTDSIWGLRVMV